MPRRPLLRCPQCRKLHRGNKRAGRCDECSQNIRGTYRTKTWQQLRDQVLSEEPICRMCKGTWLPFGHVDHIVPIDLRPELRYNRSNLQALCQRCHTLKTKDERPSSNAW